MNRFISVFAAIAAGATLASCASDKPLSYEDSANVSVTGRVESIDQGSRLVTLRDRSGHSTTYYVSQQVRRLDEVKVGDSVNADYKVSVLGELRSPTDEEKANPIKIERTTSRAGEDKSPAGGTVRKIRVVTTVEKVDLPNMRVTLKGPMGDTTVVRAKSSENIKKLRVGDTIVINYIESSQISLAKAPE